MLTVKHCSENYLYKVLSLVLQIDIFKKIAEVWLRFPARKSVQFKCGGFPHFIT